MAEDLRFFIWNNFFIYKQKNEEYNLTVENFSLSETGA